MTLRPLKDDFTFGKVVDTECGFLTVTWIAIQVDRITGSDGWKLFAPAKLVLSLRFGWYSVAAVYVSVVTAEKPKLEGQDQLKQRGSCASASGHE